MNPKLLDGLIVAAVIGLLIWALSIDVAYPPTPIVKQEHSGR